MSWEKRLAGLARRVDEGLGVLKRRIGDRSKLHIASYRGYGTPDEVFLMGRVLADRPVETPSEDQPWWRNLAHSYRRLETDEVPAAVVRIRFAGATRDAVTDTEGYFRAWLRPTAALPENLWHTAELELRQPESLLAVRAVARVLTPLAGARFGVISDLDDTVIRSDIQRPVQMLRATLLGNARTRLPFDGVAAFYRALHAGATGGEQNPVFYLSSSPWNLHDLLDDFLRLNGVPEGPLLLRDWGLGHDSLLAAGHRDHKLAHIRQLLATFPLPFILIGDSGQKDPEIYREVVAEHPGRILAVYIRNVTPDPLRRSTIRELAEQIRHSGSALLLADDTLAAARHAIEHGWITDAGVAEVAGDPDVRESSARDADTGTAQLVVEENPPRSAGEEPQARRGPPGFSPPGSPR